MSTLPRQLLTVLLPLSTAKPGIGFVHSALCPAPLLPKLCGAGLATGGGAGRATSGRAGLATSRPRHEQRGGPRHERMARPVVNAAAWQAPTMLVVPLVVLPAMLARLGLQNSKGKLSGRAGGPLCLPPCIPTEGIGRPVKSNGQCVGAGEGLVRVWVWAVASAECAYYKPLCKLRVGQPLFPMSYTPHRCGKVWPPCHTSPHGTVTLLHNASNAYGACKRAVCKVPSHFQSGAPPVVLPLCSSGGRLPGHAVRREEDSCAVHVGT